MKQITFNAAVAALGVGFAAADTAAYAQTDGPTRQQQRRSYQQWASQEGEASYYGSEFNGRPMANGEKFNPNSNSAAHHNLPLGTTARVTNLRNGRNATVKVEDRGPYARNRVLDVSPRTADELGLKQQGRAPVRITPVEVPERNVRVGGRNEGRSARR